MKKFSLLFVVISFLLISEKSFSQSWLPKPVDSPYFSALEGTWTSEPYQFMGNTGTDVITCKKILNGQYLEVYIKRTDNDGITYEAMEILTPSSDGTMTGNYYHIFGKGPYNSSYTAKQDGSKITINGVGGTGTKEILIDGNSMIQNSTFTMGDMPGMTEQKLSVTYTRK